MPDILTLERVAECRERAERATEGPWIWNHGSMETDFATVFAVKDEPEHAYPENQTGVLWGDNLHADARFIAHARTDIPALCATVEALREENERLRAELKRTDEMFARAAADEQLYRERLAVVATERDALESSQEALREVVEWQCRTKCAGYSSECTDRCRAAQVFRARELSR